MISHGGTPREHTPRMHPLNYYDKHRVHCTAEEKGQAARISGHVWNIITNSDRDEVYLQNARNNDHYVDDKGRTTSFWFDKKKRVDLDGDGIIDCVDSTNVEEVMVCPATAGKEDARLRARQARQVCQSAAHQNFQQYQEHRRTCAAAPPTPGRGASLDRVMAHQHRKTDPIEKREPRVVSRRDWTPRRGDAPVSAAPPPCVQDMFKSVDQLRVESHMDITDQNFADAVTAPKSARSLGLVGAHAISRTLTARSSYAEEHRPPKPAADRKRHSSNRLEDTTAREITHWACPFMDRGKRADQYYQRPLQGTGMSCVKYDIITNDKREFWY